MHGAKQAEKARAFQQRAPIRMRTSMKSHAHRFPVTIDALVGAGLLPILGWCRHDDSHFLRTLGTKQHPGVSRDCLVRHMIMHRHDDSPFVGKRLGCRPSRVCIKLLTGLARSKGQLAVPGYQKTRGMIFRMNTRACLQLSKIVVAASCTPARKFLASLS
jgi:hypothetical protein